MNFCLASFFALLRRGILLMLSDLSLAISMQLFLLLEIGDNRITKSIVSRENDRSNAIFQKQLNSFSKNDTVNINYY